MKDSPQPHCPLEFGLTKINSDLHQNKTQNILKDLEGNTEETERMRKHSLFEMKKQETMNRCKNKVYLFVCFFTSTLERTSVASRFFLFPQHLNKLDFNSFINSNKFSSRML